MGRGACLDFYCGGNGSVLGREELRWREWREMEKYKENDETVTVKK